MHQPVLTLSKASIAHNWSQMNALSNGRAGAVVKANAYGLGVELIAKTLWETGARSYFVATIEEAIELAIIIPEAHIYELSGFSAFVHDLPKAIIPVLGSMVQLKANTHNNFGIQLDTGLARAGFDLTHLDELATHKPCLIMSHLACADEPAHPMNIAQRALFQTARARFPNAMASLSATGGIMLGDEYHYDLTRPGIGIYGGIESDGIKPCFQISLPVISTREINTGASVGYSATFVAPYPMKIATVLGGYADGFMRTLSNNAVFFAGNTSCPILGRISMDAITVDISAVNDAPTSLELFGNSQSLCDLAKKAGTIPYELLTSLGNRYKRVNVASL